VRDGAIHPVILAGGSGTRLWPLSRTSLPKQLLALHGERTMLQNAVLRARVPGAAAPVVVCAETHRFLVAEQMQTIGVKPDAIVLEPVGRNTAPAVAVASLLVAEKDPTGVVLLLPSDHVIIDGAAFHAALGNAIAAAREGAIVTFGLKPERPESEYGYIQTGAELRAGVRAVKRFVEKPEAKRAADYIAAGDYLWNSGMFVFRADVMLAELDRHAPGIVDSCKKALASGTRDPDFVRLDPAVFATAQNISIDFAVMEKTDKAAVVPCDLGWSDVGSWSSLWSLEKQDESGNVLQGDVVVHDSHNSFVRSDKGLTALVGVRDVVVIVTDDAVLVSDKHRAQDVKAIVDQLKSADRTEAKDHTTVSRPWGSYKGIDIGDNYQVKHIMVKPGGRLSLQMHHKRAEHWIVVRGTARVTNGDKIFTLRENESTFIPLGAKHRLENMGETPLHLIEVQCGSYLGEDDIVRFDDVYGRVPESATIAGTVSGKK
jgi:mannose-1-phosphate guanylyltransferase/mannose-6-phosphate isomerase